MGPYQELLLDDEGRLGLDDPRLRRKHTYRFASGVSVKPGATITLKTGVGRNTTSTRFWGRSYGAVWNNTGTEYAYLRDGNGTLRSQRGK